MAFRAERRKLSSSYAIILFNISHKQVFRHALVVEIYLQQERKNNLLTDSTRTKKKTEKHRWIVNPHQGKVTVDPHEYVY